MGRKIIYMLGLCVLHLAAYSQADGTIWNSEQKAEDNKYILNLPDQWKKVPLAEGSGTDFKFDFTGVGIPATVGGSPLYGNFTISRMAGNRHGAAMDQIMTDFSGFYDRVTEPGYNYDTTTAPIKTGETGTVLHTRYYRRSKVSNYSKYYMVVYSPKSDETYVLTLNFQYKDPSYDIERTGHFTEYAMQVFGHFEFR
jgi:hypothetical protein